MRQSLIKIFCFFCIFLHIAYKLHAKPELTRVVGSTTLYPFITVIAENFGEGTPFPTPVVEATGTGGGMKLFCSDNDNSPVDIVGASRAMREKERQLCKKNKIEAITEITLGLDGIVFTNALNGPILPLKKSHIFKALAYYIPDAEGKLIKNPYKKWSDIDPLLPPLSILFYGPIAGSGTRDVLLEEIMEEICEDIHFYKKAVPDAQKRKKMCHRLREDDVYVETPENDHFVIHKLQHNPDAIGIFGFSFLDKNRAMLKAHSVDNVEPSYKTIANRRYPLVRSLFLYVKSGLFHTNKALNAFVQEIISEKAIGENGYVALRGLVPLPKEERSKMQEKIQTLLY